MVKIPVSVILQSEPGRFLGGMNLSKEAMNSFVKAVQMAEKEQEKLARTSQNLISKIGALSEEVARFVSGTKAAFSGLISGGGISNLLEKVAGLDKTMYQLSRTARLTGQNFADMEKHIDQISQTTKLGAFDAAKFFKTVSEGTRGLKMAGQEVSNLAKNLSDEFGPSLEDVTDALQKLSRLQEKDIFLFRNMREAMSSEELSAYALRLMVVNKASQDQINTMFRLQMAMKLGTKARTKEQDDLMAYQRTIQEFEKTIQNLTKSVGQPLLDAFKKVAPHLEKVVTSVASLIEKSPKITLALGGLVAIGPILGAFSNVVGSMKNIGGGIANIFSGFGRGGKRDGSDPGKALYVQMAPGGGLVALPGQTNAAMAPGTTAAAATATAAAAKAGLWSRTAGAVTRMAKPAGVVGALGYAGGMAADYLGAPPRLGAGLKAGGSILSMGALGAAMGGPLAPVTALIGAIGGAVMEFDNLKVALGFTEEASKDAAKAQEELAKKTKDKHDKEVEAAEEKIGMSVKDRGFGIQYALAGIAQKRLMAGGMDEEKAKKEVQMAARGAGSAKYFAAMRGTTGTDVAKEMRGSNLEELMGADKFAEELKGIPKIAKDIASQFELLSLHNLMLEVEQINSIFGMINNSLKEQASLQAEIFGDDQAAGELLDQAISNEKVALALTIQQRNAAREIISAHGGIDAAKARVVELSSKGVDFDNDDREELNKIQNALSHISTLEQTVVSHKRNIVALEKSRIEVLEPQLQLMEQQYGLMESQSSMVRQMYLGAGPTLEFQINMVQQLEKQKGLIGAQIAETQRLLSVQNLEEKDRLDLQNKLLVLQQKQVGLTTKQLELTKNLREGYLDAMTTMTNAEGTFAKFVLRKEMGAAEIQRRFLGAGGLRVGMLGAGAAAPTMRWKPGGGPGALQFMGPQALMQLGQQYGEEYGPMTAFANVPSALAATPFGQFGAQAPEAGAAGMGGRAGQPIVVPGMGGAAGKAPGAPGAMGAQGQAGTTGDPLIERVDKIIKIIEGHGETTKKSVEEGMDKSRAKSDVKEETKARQEATKQAQAMRQGTAAQAASPQAQAAITKEEQKLAESERLEKERFDLLHKGFTDWDAAAKGVNTAMLGYGKRGGGGAAGVRYAGEPGRGMTTAGYEPVKDFTPEQVQAVSRRLVGQAGGGGNAALLSMLSAAPTAPGADVSGYLEEELGGIEERMAAKGRARDIVQATLERNRAELAGESPAEKKLRTEKEKQAQAQAELTRLQKDEKRLVAESGEEAGWLNKTGRVLGDIMSNSGRAFGNTFRALGAGIEEDAASTKEEAAQIRAKYEAAYAESDKQAMASRNREETASRDLFANRAKQLALQKQINEFAAKSKEREEEAAKAAEDRKSLSESIAKGEQLLQEHQKGLENLSKDKETLEKQLVQEKGRAAAYERAAAQKRKAIEEQAREVIKTMSKDSEKMAKEEASFKESKISLEGRELQKTRQQYDREQKTLSDQIAKRQENITTLEKIIEAGHGGAEAEKQLTEHRNALNELISKKTNLQEKGFEGETAGAGIHGTDEETTKAAAAAAVGAAAGIHGLDQATARAAAEAVEKRPAGARLIEEEPEATRPTAIPHYVDLAASERRMAYLREKTEDFLPRLEQKIAQDEGELQETVKKKNEALIQARPDPAFAELAKMGTEEAGRVTYKNTMERMFDPKVMGMNLSQIPIGGDKVAEQQAIASSGEKQVEQLEKVNSKLTEQTKTQEQIGQEQVNAQKEAGQNLKSTLEQQKIDVSPVVTAVNPACATAIAGAATGGWIARMAEGGRLPGFGGGDRVLAMLEPGEFVVNKKAAAAFPGLLDNINKFQGGGMAGMVPSPAIARQGGTIAPSFNISVRGDTAKTLVGSVSQTLSGLLNDMFTPQGTSGRLFDIGSS